MTGRTTWIVAVISSLVGIGAPVVASGELLPGARTVPQVGGSGDPADIGESLETMAPPTTPTAGFAVPDGGTSVTAVTAISGSTVIIGPDPGTGPADCTLGGGPGMHCVNGTGAEACSTDGDCPNRTRGACDLDANCFFG